MSEIIFILTTLYVAYVFYHEFTPQSLPPQKPSPAPSQTIPPLVIPPESTSEVSAEIVPEEPESDPVQTEIVETDDSSAHHITHLRNPLTGEISRANSYSFSKRWIKEALVTEGLLDKVYANSELNAELNQQVKQALATLKTLSRYQF